MKNRLEFWMQEKEHIFKVFKKDCLDYKDKNKRRLFIDNDSDILFVAHLDTVLPQKIVRETDERLWGVGLDDRLGCMVAYNLAMEFNVDLLLTDNEETCASTAQFHDCKDYNWIAEFDRAGKDIVTYDLDNAEFRKAIQDNGWKLGMGSYSDICDLMTEACRMNIGIGYEHAHSKDSYYDKAVLDDQITKFKVFYQLYKEVAFEADVHYKQDNYLYLGDSNCKLCGLEIGEYCHGIYICQDCFFAAISPYFENSLK